MSFKGHKFLKFNNVESECIPQCLIRYSSPFLNLDIMNSLKGRCEHKLIVPLVVNVQPEIIEIAKIYEEGLEDFSTARDFV